LAAFTTRPHPFLSSRLAEFTIFSASDFIVESIRLFIDDYNFLPHPASDFAAGGHCFIRSMGRSHQFNEFHFRHGIEQMHADAAIARNGDVRESVIESEDVLLTKIAPVLANLSKMVKSSSFISNSSGTASMISSASRIASSTLLAVEYQRKRFIAHASFNLAANDSFLK